MKRALILAVIASAFGSAQQAPNNQSDADLVTIACTIAEHSGAQVRNLTVTDFTLKDNGQPREIRSVTPGSDVPLTLALIADTSGDQEDFIAGHRDAIGQFLKDVIGPADRAVIVQIARQAWLLSDVTGPSGLDAAVAKIGVHQTKQTNLVGPVCRNVRLPHTCGESALWHGVYHTAERIKSAGGRKVIIILSDGIDTGSDRTEADAIEAAQSAGAVVYSLKYSSPANLASARKVVQETFGKGLEHLDRETGGLTFPESPKKIADEFSRIAADLHNMVVLAFVPPPDARDGRFHKLELKPTRSGLAVRIGVGYWASREN